VKVLLDECVDGYLARELTGREATTVGRLGWSGTKNGRLLGRAIDAGFDAFVTTDRSVPFQNNIAALALTIIVLDAKSNNWNDLKALLPQLLWSLDHPLLGTAAVIRTG
jgi:hypothetical protein